MDFLNFSDKLELYREQLLELDLSEEVIQKYVELHKEGLLEAFLRLKGSEIEHQLQATRFCKLTGLDYNLDLSVTDIENSMKDKNFPVEKILKATSLFEDANKAMASGWVASDNFEVYSSRLEMLENLQA